MSIKNLIARELEYFSPMIERELSIPHSTRELWRQETLRERQARISLEMYQICNGTIKYGPFKGLKLSDNPWWGGMDLGGQCLGLYEKEILNLIGSIEQHTYDTFVDIGAADGYYAIGMLMSKKTKNVIAFEKTQHGRQVIVENWKRNGEPGTLQVVGEANEGSIKEIFAKNLGRVLILVDIEGHEFDLLSGSVLSTLKEHQIIVEIHNWVENFSSRYEKFLTAASRYFKIDVIERQERNTTEFPELRDWTDDNRLLLASERRPCLMRFLSLAPI